MEKGSVAHKLVFETIQQSNNQKEIKFKLIGIEVLAV